METNVNFADRNQLNAFDREMTAAIEAVCARHGVKVQRGRGTFNREGTTLDLKYSFSTINADGSVNTKAKSDFLTYASMYGFQAEDFGKVVDLGGEKFKIAGVKPGAPKKNMVLERVADGKTFVGTHLAVLQQVRPEEYKKRKEFLR